jgi:tetratricopeptide (TPR) repeat protein
LAIEFDKDYAPAWALRASVQNYMATYSLTDSTEGFRAARDDAERAIALDPNSPSGYLALARTQVNYGWNWDTANTCLTKAAALEPGNADLFRIHAYLSSVLGNPNDAVKFAEQAVALALELNSQAAFVHFTMTKILIEEAKPQQALAEIEKDTNEWEKLTGQAVVYHALGREHESNSALAELITKHDKDSAYQIAEAHAFRGELDKSFAWLERAYKQRDPGVSSVKADPLLKNLRHDPRYFELLKKMRLPA